MTTVKRKDLSVKEKAAILESYDALPKMSQRKAAKHLNISQPLLCNLLKTRGHIERAMNLNENLDCKRRRKGKDSHVESALKMWLSSVRELDDSPISSQMMCRKAEELAKEMGKESFVATNGWFHRWKKRENIVLGFRQNNHSELPCRIREFDPQNVYIAGGTGLYYRALPQHAFLFDGESHESAISLKDHLTVFCCVSVKGVKQKLLVIGKHPPSSCFKGVRKLPVDYYFNSGAWMTEVIFNKWLITWDKELKNDIILVVDQPKAYSVTSLLKHIKVVLLPACTVSLLENIMYDVKTIYRCELRKRLLEAEQDSLDVTADELAMNTTLLEAMHILAMSWKGFSESVIRNACSMHGFLNHAKSSFENVPTDTQEECTKTVEIPWDMAVEDFMHWMTIDEKIQVTETIDESDVGSLVMEEEESCEQEPAIQEIQRPSLAEMRQALRVLRSGVQHLSDEFEKQFDYEMFINELIRKKVDE